MIDIARETVLSLAEAATRLPRRRAGKRPSVQTLYRWAQHGVKGVTLETIQVAGTKCTSMEALQRFCERCTNPSLPPSNSTPSVRRRQIDRAERELKQEGI